MERQAKLKNKLFSKAFALRSAGDSQGVRLYSEALVDAGASLAFLESAIYTLAKSGNREGLRRALYQYLRLRGVLCE